MQILGTIFMDFDKFLAIDVVRNRSRHPSMGIAEDLSFSMPRRLYFNSSSTLLEYDPWRDLDDYQATSTLELVGLPFEVTKDDVVAALNWGRGCITSIWMPEKIVDGTTLNCGNVYVTYKNARIASQVKACYTSQGGVKVCGVQVCILFAASPTIPVLEEDIWTLDLPSTQDYRRGIVMSLKVTGVPCGISKTELKRMFSLRRGDIRSVDLVLPDATKTTMSSLCAIINYFSRDDALDSFRAADMFPIVLHGQRLHVEMADEI
ncbi:hypothetical protein AeRB84_021545 [Aphanomyces euteiches]|nr:hypothetical protein AeRB84_021545 [Aphanomyces euteiches]